MKKKYSFILLIIILLLTILTGCYDAVGIENTAYAIAIGIDKGSTNTIRLSIQFSLPNSDGIPEPGGGGQSGSSEVVSIEASNIDSAISLINDHINKKVNLSHSRVIVISSELATNGISEYVYTLANNIQIRPNTNIIISKVNAYDFLSKTHPTLETLSARYYDLILNSSRYTGHSDNVTLADFYSSILDSSRQAYAILRKHKQDRYRLRNYWSGCF